MTTETKNNYISLKNLTLYNDLIKEEISKADSTTLSDANSYSDANLETAKNYADSVAEQKSQVQIITWGDND